MTRPAILLQVYVTVVVTIGVVSCGGSPTGPEVIPPISVDAVLVGAGDIANCSSRGSELTAALLDNLSGGTVFAAGDNAYPRGSLDDYKRCYEPTWGRHKARTLPSPGNHEYETAGAAGYFAYFGARAGPGAVGYYSVPIGQWLVLMMNSNIDASEGSAQVAWLRYTLQQFHGRCVAAIWHHPIVSSGPNGGSREMVEVWRVLHEAGADLVITGHEHIYERYAPLDAQMAPTARGMRQFVVGTGGTHLTRVLSVRSGSEVQASVWGVLKLILRSDTYEWEFIPAEVVAFRDQGRDVCR